MVNREARLVAFRLNEEELARLDALAKATERDRSKVLRALLRSATVREPDVRAEPLEGASAEARHA